MSDVTNQHVLDAVDALAIKMATKDDIKDLKLDLTKLEVNLRRKIEEGQAINIRHRHSCQQ